MSKSSAVAIHMRWATRGRPDVNINNHPHAFGRGSLIHNGTITHADELATDESITTRTECDSEVLAHVIGRSRQRSRIDRVADALGTAKAYSDEQHQRHAAVVIWPDLIIVAKAGKPLAWLDRPEGRYFASISPSSMWDNWCSSDADWLVQSYLPQPHRRRASFTTRRMYR